MSLSKDCIIAILLLWKIDDTHRMILKCDEQSRLHHDAGDSCQATSFEDGNIKL